jgi:hypothetical protein
MTGLTAFHSKTMYTYIYNKDVTYGHVKKTFTYSMYTYMLSRWISIETQSPCSDILISGTGVQHSR